jgi:ribosome-binding ATPase YchF (GTP1/OBG family)
LALRWADACARALQRAAARCASLTRVAPQIVDIAGLVKGASSGEGLGARSALWQSLCARARDA